ncbi:MAG: HRDC domain-containing protein [Planctomycetota bacterium]
MSHQTVTTAAHLEDLCARMKGAERIGFDTEFVSEDTFRPQLCLVQVVVGEHMAVIDPQEVDDVEPFWRVLAEGDHTTVVHAAREEINFSLTAIGAPPANIFDTQLAAGFCSTEYPAAYSSVVTRFLRRKLAKGEQRTDWRKRPLTAEQINYALEDVRHLFALHDTIAGSVEKLGRTEWLAAETEAFVAEVIAARSRMRWRKVSGAGSLPARGMAIVRELWMWRYAEAERRDLPPKRILRDDLIVELAKRRTARPEKIRAVRGMQYGQLKKSINAIAECVQKGLDASVDDLLPASRHSPPPQLNLLGQFLSPAITSICRSESMAASLTCTATDVRDLIAYRLGFAAPGAGEPVLASGWRAELVGNLIDDLLAGRKSIRIDNPKREHPLAIESTADGG